MRPTLIAGIAAVAASLIAVPTAASAQISPQNVICNGSLGAVTVDNLEVLEGMRCTLNRTVILGSVTVKPTARLTADYISVRGNVESDGAAAVIVRTSTIAGDAMAVQGGIARFVRNTVGGDIFVDGQSGGVIVNGNRVGTGIAGNVEIYGNTGGVQVFTNRIGGNLQCKDNLPAPTGGGNVATGNKEDQCLTF